MKPSQEIAYYFILSLLAAFVVILCLVLIFFCRKKPVESEESLPAARISAQWYPSTDIDAATDGFNHRRIVGTGRLGTVYAAVLPSDQKPVAVKRIHPSLVLSNACLGFSSMLKTLSLAQHPNVVPILGFSQAPGERIIVMEFVSAVSLDYYLHENSDGASSVLDWSRRLRIAAGAARGLEYLHGGMAPNIVHGCFKASNVLLDDKLCARVSGYGLSSLVANEKRGLVGYVDDEFWSNGRGEACKESDVYGFGVVLLELLTGRRAEEGLLVRWALPLIKEMRLSELLDLRLAKPSDTRAIIRLAKVASACVNNSRKSRPTMFQVATILSNLEIELGV
ncbi:serine/threonine-protein kinase-like protein ACR4 [Populus nigra]|uniref:serine/threonine-protein kinase-like protein ACR4 n=1 Tax=Populus nigra TaxID=3691 RepID=UPI002B26F011|nr:serine/threonine-protein kinase-like protein ACR4 [Populus nigra]